jgi:hypothetical protein
MQDRECRQAELDRGLDTALGSYILLPRSYDSYRFVLEQSNQRYED